MPETDDTDYRALADELIAELKEEIKNCLRDWKKYDGNPNETARNISSLNLQIEAIEKGIAYASPRNAVGRTQVLK